MSRQFKILSAFLLVAVFSFGQGGFRVKPRSIAELQAEQRRVIGGWCRGDYEGARLSADDWSKLAPLTTMKTNPEFNTIVIVSRYQMNSPERYSPNATVTYYVIGQYEPGIGFTQLSGTRDVSFSFDDRGEKIAISDLHPATPFVSRQVAVTWLRRQLEAAKTDLDKSQLSRALQALEPAAAAQK